MCHVQRTEDAVFENLLDGFIGDTFDCVSQKLEGIVAVGWRCAGKINWLSLLEVIIEELCFPISLATKVSDNWQRRVRTFPITQMLAGAGRNLRGVERREAALYRITGWGGFSANICHVCIAISNASKNSFLTAIPSLFPLASRKLKQAAVAQTKNTHSLLVCLKADRQVVPR